MALNLISNFAANVAHRNLVKSDLATTSSLAKLSSGTRVVSAKDDAASLAIGSRLRAEVAALSQGSTNAGQAASMLQIADGALATISDILVRLKSLAVQSSSGQLSSTERTVLNTEFSALKSEIDRIAGDTEFNGTKLINGSDLNETTSSSALQNFGIQEVLFDTTIHNADDRLYRIEYTGSTKALTINKVGGGGPSDQTITLSSAQTTAIDALTGDDTLDITVGTTGVTVRFDRNFGTSTDILESATNNVAASNAQISAFSGTLAFNNTDTSLSTNATSLLAGITALNTDGAGYNSDTGLLRIAIANETSANNVTFLGIAGITFNGGSSGVALRDLTGASTITIEVGSNTLGTVTLGTVTSTTGAASVIVSGGFLDINVGQAIVQNNFTANGGSTTFTFKVGSGATSTEDDITFTLLSMTASKLAISDDTITTVSVANAASTAVSAAIDTLNTERANVGAGQNRLAFASSNLSASIENAEAARSALLDLDIASEISAFTSKQVLLQAGVSMLAQANQLPSNLLRLLQ